MTPHDPGASPDCGRSAQATLRLFGSVGGDTARSDVDVRISLPPARKSSLLDLAGVGSGLCDVLAATPMSLSATTALPHLLGHDQRRSGRAVLIPPARYFPGLHAFYARSKFYNETALPKTMAPWVVVEHTVHSSLSVVWCFCTARATDAKDCSPSLTAKFQLKYGTSMLDLFHTPVRYSRKIFALSRRAPM